GNGNNLAAEIFLGNGEIILCDENLRLGDLRTKIFEQGLRGAQRCFSSVKISPGNGVAASREERETRSARWLPIKRFQFGLCRTERGGPKMRLGQLDIVRAAVEG